MSRTMRLLPELQGQEMIFVQELIKDLTDDEAQTFSIIYRSRRKDPQMILLLTLLGFLGAAGIHRFVMDQIGMGILYFLTAGLCLIGTIVDLVNYKDLAYNYNQQKAQEAYAQVKHN